jgi:hypothetical protein
MSKEASAYIPRNPGDQITANDWNGVQVEIKKDIAAQVEKGKAEVKQEGVSKAENADKFDNKTPKNYADESDQKYAPKGHDHEGKDVYKRYFKRLEINQTVILNHSLGRFPIVDLYELLPIPLNLTTGPVTTAFYLYYGRIESDSDKLYTKDRGGERSPWGTPFEQVLNEYGINPEDKHTLNDVLNDFLQRFFDSRYVDDGIDYKNSKWIDEHKGTTVGDLRRQGEWNDIRWVVRPQKIGFGPIPPETAPALATDGTAKAAGPRTVTVDHLSYNRLALTAKGEINLMVLLRM